MSSASSRSIFSIWLCFARRSSSSRSCRSLTAALPSSCLAPSDLARLRAAAWAALRTRSAFASASASASLRCSSMIAAAASRSWRTSLEELAFCSWTLRWRSCIFCCCSARSRIWRARNSCSSASRRESSASLSRRRSSLRLWTSMMSRVFLSVSRIFFLVFSSSARSSRMRFAMSMASCSARFRATVALKSGQWSGLESPRNEDSLRERDDIISSGGWTMEGGSHGAFEPTAA
mmetsp:Transcript_114408/g.324091  ORF Transcript_114408/g.324091 Transcript_114408/m.324091 type:complete len:234 (-) Transcript_114408:8-709(-)